MPTEKEAKDAYAAWLAGEIDGYQRDQIVKPYMQDNGFDGSNPNVVSEWKKTLDAAETEQDQRQAFILRDTINAREKDIESRLEPGTRRIYETGIGKVESGKRSVTDLDASIQRYRDSTERTIRAAMDIRRDRTQSATPGIEWKGGRLAAGSTRGETLPSFIAASSIVDKYHRSSMPGNGIVPNLSVAGVNTDGEILTGKVPDGIVRRIYEQSISGQQPDATELTDWIDAWIDENDIYDDEIDLYADDSDTPIT